MVRKITFTLFCLAAMLGAWSGQLDNLGQDTAEKAFRRALVTFAVARTLNGVISVAQGTEVAVEPGGVGVNFAPGQMLDPINDLVERFSSVMLVASSALGVQNILLRISDWWGLNLILVLATVGFLLSLWLKTASRWQPHALRFFLIAVAVRFAVPAIVIGTDLVFETFLEAEQTAATEALRTTSDEIREMNQDTVAETPAADQSLFDRLGSFLDESLDSVNVSERLENFRARASSASEHIINLIVIFVLQTIVIPVAFLWLLVQLLRRLIE